MELKTVSEAHEFFMNFTGGVAANEGNTGVMAWITLDHEKSGFILHLSNHVNENEFYICTVSPRRLKNYRTNEAATRDAAAMGLEYITLSLEGL